MMMYITRWCSVRNELTQLVQQEVSVDTNMQLHMMSKTIIHEQPHVCLCVCTHTEMKKRETRQIRDEATKWQRARQEHSGRTAQEKPDEYEEKERDDENEVKTENINHIVSVAPAQYHYNIIMFRYFCSWRNVDNQLFRGLFCYVGLHVVIGMWRKTKCLGTCIFCAVCSMITHMSLAEHTQKSVCEVSGVCLFKGVFVGSGTSFKECW